MEKIKALSTALLVFWVIPVFAEERFDHQLRLLLHAQAIAAASDGATQHGFAGWAVVPDVTPRRPPGAKQATRKVLLIGGFLLKRGANWIEFMIGGFADDNHETEPAINPVLNIRSSFGGKNLKAYAETLYDFQARRTALITNATFPLLVRRWPMRIGLESDVFFSQPRNSYGIGPRVVMPIVPKKVSLAVAYQFRNPDANFLRQYLLITF